MSVYNPVIPYCDRIHTSLGTGTLIKIHGTPHPSSRCFAVNLQCGPSVNPRDDIALHLSPVFSPPPRVVRNTLQGQRWGPEESYGGFPFVGGQPFEIMIFIDFDQFKVAINGSHFTEFRYRLPLNRISHLAIDGEVSINSIFFEGTTQPSYAPPTAPMAAGVPPYPTSGGYQPMSGPYAAPPAPGYATGAPVYPPQASYTSPTYPTGGYPQQSYPTGSYPNPGYPPNAYPPTAYPHSPKSQNKGILGGLGGALGGLAAGATAGGIGSALLGNRLGHGSGGGTGIMGQAMGAMGGMGGHHKQKHSNPIGIPIAGLAAGAGAAALGAAVLTGHHPFKKAKKLFKHKGFKHKFGKHKFGKWKHKGWSSGSSSSD